MATTPGQLRRRRLVGRDSSELHDGDTQLEELVLLMQEGLLKGHPILEPLLGTDRIEMSG